MITNRCSPLPELCAASWCCQPALSICRIVVVLAVIMLAVVLVLRGYPVGAITGPVLVLVAGAVAATERLVRVQPVPALSAWRT